MPIDPEIEQSGQKPLEILLLATRGPPPTAVLASGSIHDVCQAVEDLPPEYLPVINALGEAVLKYHGKCACGTCGRPFGRPDDCKAHEAIHRDVRKVRGCLCVCAHVLFFSVLKPFSQKQRLS